MEIIKTKVEQNLFFIEKLIRNRVRTKTQINPKPTPKEVLPAVLKRWKKGTSKTVGPSKNSMRVDTWRQLLSNRPRVKEFIRLSSNPWTVSTFVSKKRPDWRNGVEHDSRPTPFI